MLEGEEEAVSSLGVMEVIEGTRVAFSDLLDPLWMISSLWVVPERLAGTLKVEVDEGRVVFRPSVKESHFEGSFNVLLVPRRL